MAQKYGYDAQVEINRCSENGMTQRGINEGKTLIDLQKLKYDFSRAVVQDHIDGEKYISDNELKGVVFEAQAHVESIRLTEILRADTTKQLSRNKLEGIIRTSEIKYATLIKQAEEIRGMKQDANKKEIAIAYINGQASLNREMINFYIEEERTKAVIGSAYYDALENIGKVGIKILGKSKKNKLKFKGNGTYGEINLNIEVE